MITPSAVSHYPGLFIHHTPTTLSCFINCICVVCQVAGFCIQFCTCFVLHCWPFCLLKDPFSLHLDPDLVLSTASRDRIKQANMGPAGRFLHIRQGDRSMEDYARDFIGGARRSATEKTCLMVFFWGGLAEPFKSRMPYWTPEESLEDYINLALHLSGSAFRVEVAAEFAHVDHRGLIRSMQDSPLMSWRAAWSARNPPKAASAHRSPEAAVSVHGSPEAAVSAHSPPEAAVPAHSSSEAVVPTQSSPEAAVSAHWSCSQFPQGGGVR